ncbi:MAG: hypothetical protein ACXVFQ_19515 [Solirubrobacteraceae bacterium]
MPIRAPLRQMFLAPARAPFNRDLHEREDRKRNRAHADKQVANAIAGLEPLRTSKIVSADIHVPRGAGASPMTAGCA